MIFQDLIIQTRGIFFVLIGLFLCISPSTSFAKNKVVVIPLNSSGNQSVSVVKTGQSLCYEQTGPISCAGTGQDGELQKGIAKTTPRFVDNNNGTVTDKLTGLIWLKKSDCTTFFNTDSTGKNNRAWSEALIAAGQLAKGYCGLQDGSSVGDWRLPNVNELQSLISWGFINPAVSNAAGNGKWTEGNPFTGYNEASNVAFWSSTTFAAYWMDTAWVVNLGNGYVAYNNKADVTPSVWPVKGGE